MRAAIYARVSTERQERQQTIDSQLVSLRRWAEAEGHALAETHVFRDEGYSGSRLDRPGLDSLRDAVNDAAVEIVAVLSPDRLARRYAYQVLLLEEFRRAGVEVAFLQRPISEDPSDQLLLQIQGAIAEYERAVLAERFRRGKLQKARDGHLLSAKPPYGYRYVPRRDAVPGHLVVDDAEAEMVRRLYAWVADEQLSVRQGVRRLNEGPWVTRAGRTRWAPSTVHHILSDPVYIGTAYANRYEYVAPKKPRTRLPRCEEKTCRRPRPRDQWIAIPVPALVDQETWDRAQAQMARNALVSFRNNKKHDYLLRCLLKCGICGLAIHGCGFARTAGGLERLYYRCAGVDALTTGRDTKCPRAMIDAEVIERAVWGHVVGLLSEPQQLVAQFERFIAETADGSPQEQAIGRQLQARLDRLARADQRLLEAYQAEVISLEELAERRRAIAEQHRAAAQQRDQHRRLAEQRVRAETVLANVAAFSERICARLEDADFGERQAILQLIIERIVVHEDTLEIHHVIPLRDPGPANGSAGPAMPRDAGLRSDGVRPARSFEDRPRLPFRLVEPIEPSIGVRLQDAGEFSQVSLGMLASAVR
jgi:site-specific DNA recombinase